MIQSTTLAPVKGPIITAAQMVEHEGLVRWVVRQQWLGDVPFLDALHAGRCGLWQALRQYDPTRGTRVSTYAVPAIARAVWRAVEHDRVMRSGAGAGQSEPAPVLPDPVEALHQRHVQTTLHALVATLPPRLHHIIVAHYGLDTQSPQSFAAIGGRLGLTRQRVQQLHVTALLWLAHPAHSRALRHLVDRHSRRDYQSTLSRQYQHARRRSACRSSVFVERHGATPSPSGPDQGEARRGRPC